MHLVSAEETARLLSYPDLVDALRAAFRDGVNAPTRHHHAIPRPDGADGTLLLMPAWNDFDRAGTSAGGYLGVKIVTVNPDNNAKGKPAIMGVYLLSDGETGEPLALIDGQVLTARRTAAASALAASFLARKDASRLTVLGAGALAPELVRAHSSVRAIASVTLWNRNRANAESLAESLRAEGFSVDVAEDREQAVRNADIVSSATLSREPLVLGEWLAPGTHVDLVGAFNPQMRESDDAAVTRASLFVDTFDGALTEGGDLVQPMKAGVISRDDVRADLAMLCRGDHPGRQGEDEITLFKSTGTALEDLAAGRLAYERATAG